MQLTGLMHGAALLYNLLLAEQKKGGVFVPVYRERLQLWCDSLKARGAEVLAWDRAAFWRLVLRDLGARVRAVGLGPGEPHLRKTAYHQGVDHRHHPTAPVQVQGQAQVIGACGLHDTMGVGREPPSSSLDAFGVVGKAAELLFAPRKQAYVQEVLAHVNAAESV